MTALSVLGLTISSPPASAISPDFFGPQDGPGAAQGATPRRGA